MLWKLKNVLLLLSLCGTCRADPPVLPLWTEVDGKACYDLVGARALHTYATDCTTLALSVPLQDKKIALLEGQLVDKQGIITSCTAQKVALEALNVSADKAIVDLKTDLATEREWSLRGGALLYVVIGVALVAVSSGVAGYEIKAILH